MSAAKRVDIGSIEPELWQLWREQAVSRTPPHQPMILVRTLNLIVFAPAATHDEIAALLDPLVAEHPARVIALCTAAGEQPQAWVSASRAHTVGGRGCIGRELIAIAGAPEQHRELRSIVLPLLVHDLPVYLWWRGRPAFGEALFEDLAALADRIVIDSAQLHDPLRQLPGMARALDNLRGALSDLAWARLTPWRQLTSQFFDSPAFCPQLQRLRHVVIEAAEPLRSEPMLLASWIASRLGWQPLATRSQPHAMDFRHEDAPVRIDFHQVGATPAAVGSLTLATDEATFRVEHGGDDAFVTSAHLGGTPLHRSVPLKDESETSLISRELDLPGRDLLYEQALAMLRRLLEL